MYGVRLANRLRADFAQANAADLALLDQIGQGLDRGLDRDGRINPRTLKDVDSLDATQHLEGMLDRLSNSFRTAIRPRFHVVSAFDAEHDLAGVLRILLEVILE